jgi:hypothetical protein
VQGMVKLDSNKISQRNISFSFKKLAKICQKSVEITMPVSKRSLAAQGLVTNCKNRMRMHSIGMNNKIFEKSAKESLLNLGFILKYESYLTKV